MIRRVGVFVLKAVLSLVLLLVAAILAEIIPLAIPRAARHLAASGRNYDPVLFNILFFGAAVPLWYRAPLGSKCGAAFADSLQDSFCGQPLSP